jgi:hypothetical protein
VKRPSHLNDSTHIALIYINKQVGSNNVAPTILSMGEEALDTSLQPQKEFQQLLIFY